MNLKSAVMRAAAFCPPGGMIHFIWARKRSFIFVAAPRFSVLLFLDWEMPSFSTDGKGFAKALRKIRGKINVEVQSGSVVFENEHGSISVPYMKSPTSVIVPPIPFDRLVPVSDWGEVHRVFHAASPPKDVIRNAFQYVCFARAWTGATDGASIACVSIGIGLGQLFPAEAFTHWPAGPVSAFLDSTAGWFRAGDEVRIVPVKWDWFPSLPELLDRQLTRSAVFDRKHLLEVVSSVVRLSEMKQIRIHGTGYAPGYVVLPLGAKQQGVRYAKPDKPGFEIDLSLDGRRVIAALKALGSEKVVVQWEMDRLRIQSGRYTEDIFPLVAMT